MFIQITLIAYFIALLGAAMYYIKNKKIALGIFVAAALASLWGMTQIHGGVRVMAKAQMDCIGEGESVSMDSKYNMIWNKCAINRGTVESPRWVISARDVGVDGLE
jgi:hypothetical protein